MVLRGKKAIITGGAVRIGRVLALCLAERGVDLCLHYGTSAREAQETLERIRACGVRCELAPADLRDPTNSAAAVIERAAQSLGGCDILVNSAAVFAPSTLGDLTEQHFDNTLAINLKAPLFLCREFVSQLPAGAIGHIVNIVDWRATRPQPGHLAYTISKAALAAATKILALELAPRVRVNAIAPGAILPPPGKGQDHLLRIAEHIPLRRPGHPDEIARALVFLLESEFVTGEVLHVTGGEEL